MLPQRHHKSRNGHTSQKLSSPTTQCTIKRTQLHRPHHTPPLTIRHLPTRQTTRIRTTKQNPRHPIHKKKTHRNTRPQKSWLQNMRRLRPTHTTRQRKSTPQNTTLRNQANLHIPRPLHHKTPHRILLEITLRTRTQNETRKNHPH